MTEYCYLNGKILPVKKAAVNVQDIGILRGYGVFDFTRTHHGRLAMFLEHANRFRRSAQKLDLIVPVSNQKLLAIIETLIRKNKYAESTVRMVLTGGQTIGNGLEFDQTKPTFFVLVQKFVPFPKDTYGKGVKVITIEHQRVIPEAKTNNYIVAVQHQKLRQSKGAFEILYFSSGKFLEATTSNFFIVKKRTVITPKNNILLGTTRNAALKLARKKFVVQERDIPCAEIQKADEAFLTAANKAIIPVVRVDEHMVGKGTIGPVTKELMQMFKQAYGL